MKRQGVQRSLRSALVVTLTLIAQGCDPADQPLPNVPIGNANGIYANRCCGQITLLNGKMTFAGQQVDYVIDIDKVGTFIQTAHYVGPSSGGFVVRRDLHPLKMRMDAKAHPSAIELIERRDGGLRYTFRLVTDS